MWVGFQQLRILKFPLDGREVLLGLLRLAAHIAYRSAPLARQQICDPCLSIGRFADAARLAFNPWPIVGVGLNVPSPFPELGLIGRELAGKARGEEMLNPVLPSLRFDRSGQCRAISRLRGRKRRRHPHMPVNSRVNQWRTISRSSARLNISQMSA